jgi:alkylhydroperoxidase family enzyme
MARMAFTADSDTVASDIAKAIRQRRGGSLLKMDRVMLHSPVYAGAWNSFLKTVIDDLTVPVKLSQFVMCVIGVLNDTDYELLSHAPKFIAAGGTQTQLDALVDIHSAIADAGLFNLRERAVLKLTMEMTKNVQVSSATFEEARGAMRDSRELVDLVGLIATYNMVSRFVVAFDIHPDDGEL